MQLNATSRGSPRTSSTGKQFMADLVEGALQTLGIKHREGAVGQSGSIAIVERFWLTTKQMLDLGPLGTPTSLANEVQRRLEAAMTWYSFWRPHQALGGATPNEVYHHLTPAVSTATPAPRGAKGARLAHLPYRIAFALEPEQRLPYLVKIAA